MNKKTKYSKDNKVSIVALEDFLKNNGYLTSASNSEDYTSKYWTPTTKPEEFISYYKITNEMFIYISYNVSFGPYSKKYLESIEVAYRDGKTEYELFDKQIAHLEEEAKKHKYSKLIPKEIELTKKAKGMIPKFELPKNDIKIKPFDSYLIDTGLKMETTRFSKKYVVLDVETNGLRRASDDLLSISIYDPSSGIAYNRFLPLDLQPLILTSYINGITEDQITDCAHLTQDEIDWLIKKFDLKNTVILSYSGGDGKFDSEFVINYCKRNKLKGFESLEYQNIKSCFPTAPFGCEGELTKDNLCRIFKIEGVKEIHSGLNDCILEWKLFEKVAEKPLFFIDNALYCYNQEYIIPVSYLIKHPELEEHAGLNIPVYLGLPKLVYTYNFPETVLHKVKKFPTNITGVAIEHLINSMLKVHKQNNINFLANNKQKLEFLGVLGNKTESIPVMTNSDGTFTSVNEKNAKIIDEVNSVNKTIMKEITPVIDFINNSIFKNDYVMSQELVFGENNKILALCDLSSENAVLEIKTFNCFIYKARYGACISPKVSMQLYYESNGRKPYVLQRVFDKHFDFNIGQNVLDGLRIDIYEVKIQKIDKSTYYEYVLCNADRVLLELLKFFPETSLSLIERITGKRKKEISKQIKILVANKYVENIGTSRKANWIVSNKYSPVFDENRNVYLYDPNKYDRHLRGSTMIKEYSSIKSASKELNLPVGFIAIACETEERYHTQYLFSYEKNKKKYR